MGLVISRWMKRQTGCPDRKRQRQRCRDTEMKRQADRQNARQSEWVFRHVFECLYMWNIHAHASVWVWEKVCVHAWLGFCLSELVGMCMCACMHVHACAGVCTNMPTHILFVKFEGPAEYQLSWQESHFGNISKQTGTNILTYSYHTHTHTHTHMHAHTHTHTHTHSYTHHKERQTHHLKLKYFIGKQHSTTGIINNMLHISNMSTMAQLVIKLSSKIMKQSDKITFLWVSYQLWEKVNILTDTQKK